MTAPAQRMRRSLPRWLLYFGCATGLGLFFGSQTVLYYAFSGGPVRWTLPLGLALIDWYTWALLAPLILRLGHAVPIDRSTWQHAVTIHLGASILISIIKIGTRVLLGHVIPGFPAPRLSQLLLGQMHVNLVTYWVILGVSSAFEYYGKYRERELRASQLESRLAQAQLEVLRTQLQPHFLFNTLHAISALMQEGEIESADRMITRLSDLLRLALESARTQEVRLEEEMEFLERYLEIQQIRFQERLRVTVDVAPETLDALVPSLILQPLVENAIRHGIASRAAGGHVSILAARENDQLRLDVCDDGPGMITDGDNGRGLGLANTRARLEQLYGSGHELTLSNQRAGGLAVRIRVPFRRVPRADA